MDFTEREPLEVHVDWRMTPGEWQQLVDALSSSDAPYLQRLRAEGKLPAHEVRQT